ncbi:hypothetical protein AG1IA_03488 [Rhizoctonia solani AG-1 IA]|uniref:Uncharacterized protein n=1 Tax=Thanatephorus cucumeris (strain AG1-IA) TaxID=983506 RepID=L8X0B3_THACA|nr:hypothetical protein AG1IA_03488 [Rhizoctonia solani AG-1 IA]
MKATKVVLLAASFGLAQFGFRSTSPVPNPTNPIGLKYPGTTITKGENWAGVLTTKVNESLILTWDYAVSGQQVTGVVKQIGEQFIPTAGKRPSWCPWNATNSLFVTWIGINDINRGVVSERLPMLFGLQHDLYQNGARNFLFLNLPPFDRAPGAGYSQQVKGEIAKWNTALPTHIANFTATHKGATAFLYDTQVLWDEFYAKPDAFNITNPDTIKGGLWYDEYHPSTEIQRVIGQRVANQAAPFFNCLYKHICLLLCNYYLGACCSVIRLDCTIHKNCCLKHNLAKSHFHPLGLHVRGRTYFQRTGRTTAQAIWYRTSAVTYCSSGVDWLQFLDADGYNKPFFVTYMNTASFALYLIPALAKHALGERNSAKRDHVREGYQALVDDDESGVNDEHSLTVFYRPRSDHPHERFSADCSGNCQTCVNILRILVRCQLDCERIARVYERRQHDYLVQYEWCVVHAEPIQTRSSDSKGSFAGSVLVSLADSPGTESPITGSPRFNSGHSHPQAIVVRIGDESRINMQLFFGFVGIFNVLGFWPIGVLLHYTGVEMFDANTPQMFITLSSDFIYVLAMLKTTPLVVTVGLSLTIPLAVAGDLFLGTSTSAQAIVGATLVLFAFVVIGLGDREEASGSTGALHNESDRGRPTERHDGQRQVPPFSHLQDDEDLRKSVEAIFASRREQARRIRRESGRTESGTTQEINNQGGTSDGREYPAAFEDLRNDGRGQELGGRVAQSAMMPVAEISERRDGITTKLFCRTLRKIQKYSSGIVVNLAWS